MDSLREQLNELEDEQVGLLERRLHIDPNDKDFEEYAELRMGRETIKRDDAEIAVAEAAQKTTQRQEREALTHERRQQLEAQKHEQRLQLEKQKHEQRLQLQQERETAPLRAQARARADEEARAAAEAIRETRRRILEGTPSDYLLNERR